ncbi:MAG: hypothetical protein MZU84_01300 [Sphingobacterium sp.]|nr:hypothetical protein [Sphingobacterium sp.]
MRKSPQVLVGKPGPAGRDPGVLGCPHRGDHGPGSPESWPDYAVTEWNLLPPAFEEYAGKLSRVLPDTPEETRRSLFSRARGICPLLYRCALLERQGTAGPPPSEAILGLMPQEAAAALYAASLCENVLDVHRFHDFLERLGLLPKAREIVLALLGRTGYPRRAGTPKLVPDVETAGCPASWGGARNSSRRHWRNT